MQACCLFVGGTPILACCWYHPNMAAHEPLVDTTTTTSSNDYKIPLFSHPFVSLYLSLSSSFTSNMYTPRSDWRRNDPNIRPSSVATSYNSSPPLTKKPSKTALEMDHSDDKMHKLARRPIPGKSVAALQQQHQYFMQRSMSPSGSVRSNASSERGVPQQQQRLSPLSNNHHHQHQQQQQQEDYLQHPQEGVEDRPVSPSATIRSEQSSLAASTGSSQQTIIRRLSTSSSQESKVIQAMNWFITYAYK